MYNQETYDIYKAFIAKQNYSEMYVYQLLDMYSDCRFYYGGAWPVPDPKTNGQDSGGADSAELAEKMLKITNEIESRIARKGR